MSPPRRRSSHGVIGDGGLRCGRPRPLRGHRCARFSAAGATAGRVGAGDDAALRTSGRSGGRGAVPCGRRGRPHPRSRAEDGRRHLVTARPGAIGIGGQERRGRIAFALMKTRAGARTWKAGNPELCRFRSWLPAFQMHQLRSADDPLLHRRSATSRRRPIPSRRSRSESAKTAQLFKNGPPHRIVPARPHTLTLPRAARTFPSP